MVAVADTKDGIAAVCNLAKRPRSIYLLYYLPPKNYGCRPQRGGYGARAPPLNTLLIYTLLFTRNSKDPERGFTPPEKFLKLQVHLGEF
jgi:hypothetical protein